MRRLLLLAVLAALALPAQALAHATLEQASPGFGARVAAAPKTLTPDWFAFCHISAHPLKNVIASR